MPARPAICLDVNAGAPPRPEVVAALLPLLQEEPHSLFNPSSTHAFGRKAKRLLNQSKEKIATSLGSGISSDSILLTSSGTEANQTAIRGVLERHLLRGEKPHWVTSAGEHDSVLQMADWLTERGGSVTLLPLRSDGTIDFSGLADALRPETSLLSFLWVNNETGVISDIHQASRIAREKGIPLHLDGAQAWGKLELDLGEVGADFVSFSAHKIGGLAGLGVLWVRPSSPRLLPTFPGKQQGGLRGGTENLLGALAAGQAASLLAPKTWGERVEKSRRDLEKAILERLPDARINGIDAPRVANTLSLSLPKGPADSVIMNLDLAGFAVSAGSACMSGSLKASHVLLAMGASREIAQSTLRISLADALPYEQVEEFARTLERVVGR